MSVYEGHGVTLHHADCLDVLRTLPDASVDSVVTDPPYNLSFMGKGWDTFPIRKRGQGGTGINSEHAGGVEFKASAEASHAFQQWCEAWATECLRILKPGGHLLAFGGSRTWHRLACAVEDAGFEVRDSIAWLHGQGFPKSLDVSKAIDKRRTEDAEPVRAICRAIRAAMDVRDLRSRHLVEHFDGCHPRLIDHWAARDTDSQPALPTWEQWEKLRDLFAELAEHDAEVWRLNGRKGKPGDNFEGREVLSERVTEVKGGSWAEQVDSGRFRVGEKVIRETAPATDAAREWAGWGTALKPAFEPVVVARKPLAGTVAANVLAHGTGALNIDATRIGTEDALGRPYGGDNEVYGKYSMERGTRTGDELTGRWPANVVLDESQAEALDEQSGEASYNPPGRFGTQRVDSREQGSTNIGPRGEGDGIFGYGDRGGASRFFYVAKADASERPRLPKRSLRLRDDLTPEQVDHVRARLVEAGVQVD